MFVEMAEFFKSRSPGQQRADAPSSLRAGQRMIPKAPFFFRKVRHPKIPVAGKAEIDLRPFLKLGHLPRKLFRMPQVIGIEKCHKISQGRPQPEIPGRRRAPVGL